MNLLEELEGEGWSIQQALLTTYPFDPQFFSEYVRPRLRKRNCDLPLVLVDADRYEREITSSDWLAAPMGRDYLLEPVYSGGVFHPKVNLYASERSVYYTVSSANLTLEEYCKAAQIGSGGGFQKYWLTDEDHSVGEEYFVARDIRLFFEELRNMEEYVTGQDASEYLRETTDTLEWLAETDPPLSDAERTTWFLSNLSDSILDQVGNRVGHVETAQMYAPFYGTPSVLRRIGETLDADRLEFIVESESTAMDVEALPDALAIDFDVRELNHSSTRWVHAKFLTLHGEWGTACLYGSPNMTSTALLEPAARGNVETALLQLFPPDQPDPLDGSLFHNTSFPFDLSDPIEDLSSLSIRERSYEGWETVDGRDSTDVRLRDAQLTQPDANDKSELILRLGGVTGDHTFVVQTDDGITQQLTATITADSELSIILDADERETWVNAVVTVSIPAEGMESNPRRVVQETQEYYREFRDITQSDGTRSSTALLRTVLQNPDTNAVNVFDVALSELRKMSQETAPQTGPPTPDGQGAPQFPERSPARLGGVSSSTPSLPTLISNHLSYQRDRALNLLPTDEQPTPAVMEQFVDHVETFWETIELCLVMDLLGELEAGSINDTRLFEVCTEELGLLFEEFPVLIQRLNGIIDRVEDETETRNAFLTPTTDTVQDLAIWADVFDSLFSHPAVLMELDYRANRDVTSPQHHFANRLKSILDAANPAIGQYLYDGPYLVSRSTTLLDNLRVEYGDTEDELNVTTQGIQVLALYLLVQKVVASPEFLTGLQNHPRFSQEGIKQLVEFVVEGETEIVEYGLVGDIQWTFTLEDAFTDIKHLQEVS